MAKAGLSEVRKADLDRIAIGRCLELARLECGLNLDEFAQRLDRNPRLVRRYETGEDRVPVDLVKPVREVFAAFIVRLAHLDDDLIAVKTVIEVRRLA